MKFRLRPGLAAATAIGLAILCSLGAWQLKRLAWKNDLIARTEARLAAAPISFDEALARAAAGETMDYQPVFLEGTYAHDLEAGVFGTYDGAPGVYVFTPLRVGDGAPAYVYVNRGFFPQRLREAAARADGSPAGNLRVEGLFRSAERKRGLEQWLAPKDQPQDNLYFVRDPRILAAAWRIAVPPYYVDSFGREQAAAWPKGGVTRITFPNRHFEYALTWFGLAAALLGVFIAASVARD